MEWWLPGMAWRRFAKASTSLLLMKPLTFLWPAEHPWAKISLTWSDQDTSSANGPSSSRSCWAGPKKEESLILSSLPPSFFMAKLIDVQIHLQCSNLNWAIIRSGKIEGSLWKKPPPFDRSWAIPILLNCDGHLHLIHNTMDFRASAALLWRMIKLYSIFRATLDIQSIKKHWLT